MRVRKKPGVVRIISYIIESNVLSLFNVIIYTPPYYVLLCLELFNFEVHSVYMERFPFYAKKTKHFILFFVATLHMELRQL